MQAASEKYVIGGESVALILSLPSDRKEQHRHFLEEISHRFGQLS